MRYFYIFSTIFFTVYGQLIIKWRITKSNWNITTSGFSEMVISYFKFLFDPFIFSGFLSAFIASVFWMLAMTKFKISFAYPFMSLSFVFVLILSAIIFKESITIGNIIGLIFIITGLIISVNF